MPPPPHDLPAHPLRDPDPRDDLDARIRRLLPATPTLPPPHADEDALIAFFQGTLSPPERAALLQHVARCALCCDRLEACADLLRPAQALTQAPARLRALTPPSAPALPLDLGDALMHVHLLVAAGGALHVVTTDAEMRLAPALLMRRASARPGLAFQRRLPHLTLQLTLVSASPTHLSASLTVTPAPTDAHVQLLSDAHVLAAEPLRAGEASFRALPIRPLRLSLRAGAASAPIGYIRLDLDPPPPPTPHASTLPHR